MKYPSTKKTPFTEEQHGVTVEDPFRWLEEIDSSEVHSWIETQNKVSTDFLFQGKLRAPLFNRLKEINGYARYGCPIRKGNRLFYGMKRIDDGEAILIVDERGKGSKVILDPNLPEFEPHSRVLSFRPSDDGRFMAYGFCRSGSDWQEWKIRDVNSLRDLPETLKWIKFPLVSWTPDGKGFFYTCYPPPKPGVERKALTSTPSLYYHLMGQPQENDALVYSRPDKSDWTYVGRVSEDGRYLILVVSHNRDDHNAIYCKDLTDSSADFVELVSDFSASFMFIGSDGMTLWFRTNAGAPNGRIVSFDLSKGRKCKFKEVLPETEDSLERASAIHGGFVGTYLKDAQHVVKVFDRGGKFLKDVSLPGIGTVFGFDGNFNADESYYTFTSFFSHPQIHRYDFKLGQSLLYKAPRLTFSPGEFETRQFIYPGKDGVNIPIFLAYKKGTRPGKKNLVYLHGYGGFAQNMTPVFSTLHFAWMEAGGIFALANIRGGGEYGDKWHKAAVGTKKQTSFDDFVAAAEWLIREKWTEPDKLAISGRSNGGLLVGACLLQRPSLFGAAIASVGVFDMIRYKEFTVGWMWASDYGDPTRKEDFEALLRYSPVHNTKKGEHYPATLIMTGDHDDRVFPAHSYKFAAALQQAQKGSQPVLLRVQSNVGHDVGTTTQMLQEYTDILVFLRLTLNLS